ncbi:hypothetical protein BJV78DRAFT_1154290 [Lactifluus subvellereus]|nr:hypothetical protein BJV78DRAFT_1154290 [Lactifluus subvellereus]
MYAKIGKVSIISRFRSRSSGRKQHGNSVFDIIMIRALRPHAASTVYDIIYALRSTHVTRQPNSCLYSTPARAPISFGVWCKKWVTLRLSGPGLGGVRSAGTLRQYSPSTCIQTDAAVFPSPQPPKSQWVKGETRRCGAGKSRSIREWEVIYRNLAEAMQSGCLGGFGAPNHKHERLRGRWQACRRKQHIGAGCDLGVAHFTYDEKTEKTNGTAFLVKTMEFGMWGPREGSHPNKDSPCLYQIWDSGVVPRGAMTPMPPCKPVRDEGFGSPLSGSGAARQTRPHWRSESNVEVDHNLSEPSVPVMSKAGDRVDRIDGQIAKGGNMKKRPEATVAQQPWYDVNRGFESIPTIAPWEVRRT